MDDASNFIHIIHPGQGNRFPFYRSELSRTGLRNQLIYLAALGRSVLSKGLGPPVSVVWLSARQGQAGSQELKKLPAK